MFQQLLDAAADARERLDDDSSARLFADSSARLFADSCTSSTDAPESLCITIRLQRNASLEPTSQRDTRNLPAPPSPAPLDASDLDPTVLDRFREQPLRRLFDTPIVTGARPHRRSGTRCAPADVADAVAQPAPSVPDVEMASDTLSLWHIPTPPRHIVSFTKTGATNRPTSRAPAERQALTYTCPRCGFEAADQAQILQRHDPPPHLARFRKCMWCCYTTNRTDHLHSHMQTHLPKAFQCSQCSKAFTRMDNCRKHMTQCIAKAKSIAK